MADDDDVTGERHEVSRVIPADAGAIFAVVGGCVGYRAAQWVPLAGVLSVIR